MAKERVESRKLKIEKGNSTREAKPSPARAAFPFTSFEFRFSGFQFLAAVAVVCAILVFGLSARWPATGVRLLLGYTIDQDNVGNGPIPSKWQTTPIHWQINPITHSNVTTVGGDPADAAIGKSFNTWQSAQLNGQTVMSLSFAEDSATSLTDPSSSDCLNTVSFVPSSGVNFPTGAIAFATVAIDSGTPPTRYSCTVNGTSTDQVCNLDACIIDADIVFNPAENFSTTTPPLVNDFDVQSVATHEIGHLLGLDHSGIAHAVMYPFGDTVAAGQQRDLAVDDTVGVAFLYPGSNFASATGMLSGQVTLSGSAIFAAHVIAIDAVSGNAVVDGLTDPQGSYNLVGVPPGNYNVLVLPLGAVYGLDDFGGWYCGYSVNSPPCCDPKTDAQCTGTPISNPIDYTGKFF